MRMNRATWPTANALTKLGIPTIGTPIPAGYIYAGESDGAQFYVNRATGKTTRVAVKAFRGVPLLSLYPIFEETVDDFDEDPCPGGVYIISSRRP